MLAGAGNPIGNLRIKEAAIRSHQHSAHATGFRYSDVTNRHEDFVEYLADQGLFVAGSSGVQGEWPKILLTEADDGLLYLDHTLPDVRARHHWLVKFQHSHRDDLRLILDCEEKYMVLAKHLGLRVHNSNNGRTVENHNGALFIPRFDRQLRQEAVIRIAQESLASLCQIAGFGVRISHNDACAAIAKACTNPELEIIEYLKRDIANIVLGNKDNHSRNTAICRTEQDYIGLTPLYDFAPMYLHPEGIARAARWAENDRGQPNWASVVNQAAVASCLPENRLVSALTKMISPLRALGDQVRALGFPVAMIERSENLAEITATELEAL